MNTLFSKYKWLQLVLGTLVLAAGIVVIVMACVNQDAIDATISISLAVVSFMLGAIILISCLIGKDKSLFNSELVYASLLISIGVILCIDTSLVSDIIVFFVATVLSAFGLVTLVKAITLTVKKAQPKLFIINFIVSAICITGGVLLFVFHVEAKQAIYIIIGSLLAAVGVLEIVIGIKLLASKPTEASENN